LFEENLFPLLLKIILYHCAPTIKGLKPASLISFNQLHNSYRLWREYSPQQFANHLNRLHLNPNIQFHEIHQKPANYSLVLFYNPELLTAVLRVQANRQFMADLGYRPDFNIIDHLHHLSGRFVLTFPHELGIFLGIPVHDVKSFIKNRGKNYIFNQYWKVYQNPQQAKKIFAAFDGAKQELLNLLRLELN
jgi:hypothetical protein